MREYVPGDRQRSINWPASTRRGRLQVNTFAAERAQDVVLLADATSDVGEPGRSALDLALRGAAAAARAYLDARDRVGVITYQWGGASWLVPGLGRRQVYRIIDSMLASDTGWSRGASFRRLPRAALPPGALVVVFSPLLDQRLVEALRDMRERGFTMLVVDVLNAEPPAPAAQRRPDGPADLADGAGGDQVLAARARRPGGALERRGVPGPAAGRLHPAAHGGAPVRGAVAIRRPPGCSARAASCGRPRRWCTRASRTSRCSSRYSRVAAGALRLALAGVPVPEDSYLLPLPLRGWLSFLETLRRVPWEEGALIAVLWLEVLHPSRPWHTAILGAALIAYLLADHLAESDASPRVLGPQVRVLAAGAGLLALGAGAGMLPAAGPGAGSALLRLVAAGALIAAGGLVLPYVARRPGT